MSPFHLYISFRLTLWVAWVPLESPLAYNIYLFNLRIANHILIENNKDNKGVLWVVGDTTSVNCMVINRCGMTGHKGVL